MHYIVNRDEMTSMEKRTIENMGIPQILLMERAALAVFDCITLSFEKESSVLVVAGNGNNGGDGLATARLLKLAGYRVDIILACKEGKKSEGFLKQFEILDKMGVSFFDEFDQIKNNKYDVVIDAIFGIGLNRKVSGDYFDAIGEINNMRACVVAIDVPSGLDVDTGKALGVSVKADKTVTMAYMKQGFLMNDAAYYTGKITVADIGILPYTAEAEPIKLFAFDKKDIKEYMPIRIKDSHKGTYGKIGIIAGSKNMAGAAIFAATAAYRMGAGIVRVFTEECNREIIQMKLPEAVLTTYEPGDEVGIIESLDELMEWADVLLVGPGIGINSCSYLICEHVFSSYDKKLIIDADGLNILSQHPFIIENHKSKIIITPHLMEMSRLIDRDVAWIKEHKYEVATEVANKFDVTVVLKDANTYVASAYDPSVYINVSGNDGMATGGSGDALAGMIAALAANTESALLHRSAMLGCYLHGICGDRAAFVKGKHSMLATDIINHISNVLCEGDYYVD